MRTLADPGAVRIAGRRGRIRAGNCVGGQVREGEGEGDDELFHDFDLLVFLKLSAGVSLPESESNA